MGKVKITAFMVKDWSFFFLLTTQIYYVHIKFISTPNLKATGCSIRLPPALPVPRRGGYRPSKWPISINTQPARGCIEKKRPWITKKATCLST
jgi:hypothetical protein